MKKTATPLRNVRRARTLNQQQMAQLLGVSQQTYSKYESGLLVPSADMQMRIAAILGSSIDALWPTDERVPARKRGAEAAA
jgi:transcriptional regulator with XRE-family HTH domain